MFCFAASLLHPPSQPPLVGFVQTILSGPRREYSTDVAALFDESGSNKGYRSGLMFLSCILGGILLIWSFILVALKLKGSAVGCAAGNAFRAEVDKGNRAASDSTNIEESPEQIEDVTTAIEYDDASFHSSISSVEENLEIEDNDEGTEYSSVPMPSRRERRTQVVFMIFGLMNMASLSLALIYLVGPLRQSADDTLEHTKGLREVISQVNASVNAFSMGIQNSFGIVKDLPLTRNDVCPQGRSDTMEAVMGFDMESVIDLYLRDYFELSVEISQSIEEVEQIIDYVSNSLNSVDKVANETDSYIWIVPAVLLALGTLTAIFLFGVFLAWKRDSNRNLQRFLSYGILPFFVIITLVCWVLATGAAISAAIGTDACTSGSSNGSPSDTVDAILDRNGIDQNDLAYSFAAAYSKGCRGPNPTAVFTSHELNVRNTVETIWQYVSAIDSAGRDRVETVCGDGNKLDLLLQGLQDLAKQLTSVHKALDSASNSLKCSRISVIYQEAVEETICSDATNAMCWGFLLFFVMSISTMSMITLRASWRQAIDEDKIYDESEVAENMIVDEHEEYLAYISRYKHEWEEYEGMAMIPEQPTSVAESVESGSSSSLKSKYSDDSGFQGDKEVASSISDKDSPPRASFDPINSECHSQASRVTSNSEDISFLSLSDIRTPQSSQSSDDGDNQLPSPLLPQNASAEPDEVDVIPLPVPSRSNKNEVFVRTSSSGKLKTPMSSSYEMVPSPTRQKRNRRRSPVSENYFGQSGNDDDGDFIGTTGLPFELLPRQN